MKSELRKVFTVFAAILVMLTASILMIPIRGVVAEANPATPDTAGLYGGTIVWIEAVDLGDNISRVFVSTQSANSVFYADIDHAQADPFSGVTFKIVPDLDAEAGFGVIQTFAVDQASGWLYFAYCPQDQSAATDNSSHQQGIYRCTIEPGSLTQLQFEPKNGDGPGAGPGLGYVNSLTIYDGHLLFVEQTWSQEKQTDICRLRFGTIDPTTGAFIEDGQSGIYLKENSKSQLMAPVVNPISKLVYIMDGGNHNGGNDVDAVIYKSSDAYDALSSSTAFSQIIPPSDTSDLARQYQSLGIAPDGIIYLAGWQQTETGNNESVVIYSANDGASWETGTRDQYCWAWQGPNFAFVNDGSGGYDIVTGNMFSGDGGAIWGMLPRTGNVWPHPGAIAFDPNQENTFYVGTDRGIAVTNDAGYSFSRAWERPEQTNVEDIAVVDLGGNKTGIFIRERENQKQVTPGEPNNNPTRIYYAEIDHSTTPPTYGEFTSVPSMGEESNWQIWSRLAGDSVTDLLFFQGSLNIGDNFTNGLFKTDGKTAPTLVDTNSVNTSNPMICNGHMFYVNSEWGGGHWDNGTWVESQSGTYLYFGTLGSGGTYTPGGRALLSTSSGLWPQKMTIGQSDNCVYLLNSNSMSTGTQTSAKIYKSSVAYDVLDNSTTFTEIDAPSSSGISYQWNAFGVGPDGRLFLGGWSTSGGGNAIAYSENGASWQTVTLDNEYCGIGNDFAFIGTVTGYDTFCGTLVSGDKGLGWSSLPRKDVDKAYPTSSCVQIDPNDSQVLYVPTSRGLGYSTDAGYHFYEMNNGIEAVQIKDLALDGSGENGWAVAKSGVYRVSKFKTDPVWSAPMDPDGNGAQYKVVTMDLTDPTGNTVYVGTESGDRVYKTTDGGKHWKDMYRPQPQFNAAELPSNGCWPNWCGNVSAVAIDPNNSDRVFVGYDTGIWGWGGNQQQRIFGQLWVIDDNYTQPQSNGLLMPGSSQQSKGWTQILLHRTDAETKQIIENDQGDGKKWYALKGDVNISDVLITSENSETVIYVAAYYSDETATPVSDEQVKNNGFHDSYGYPLVYGIYRITGDSNSGWKVESSFDKADTAITALSIDSQGNVYACGRDYNEQTYQKFVDSYKDQAMKEWVAREKERKLTEFHNEAHKEFYDELVYRLFGKGAGRQQGYMGDWNGKFEEMFTQFKGNYFDSYTDGISDNFATYFGQRFDEYYNAQLLPEFNKQVDKGFDQDTNNFDNFWQWNKPQPGLKIVYKKAIGGDWEALPLEGLNKAFSMNPCFNNNQATITIGEDPANGGVEVPYVAFNRFIYYLPENADKWVLGCEYPMGTEIYVIIGVKSSGGVGTGGTAIATSSKAETIVTAFLEKVGLAPQTVAAADDEGAYLYVGTGTGIYGQRIAADAASADSSPATSLTGNRSILMPVVGAAVAGIVAASGVVFILRRRHSHRAS